MHDKKQQASGGTTVEGARKESQDASEIFGIFFEYNSLIRRPEREREILHPWCRALKTSQTLGRIHGHRLIQTNSLAVARAFFDAQTAVSTHMKCAGSANENPSRFPFYFNSHNV